VKGFGCGVRGLLSRLAAGAVVACLAAAGASAQSTGAASPEPIETLSDAWRLALAHDQSLAAASAQTEGARASERAARGARWPTLEAGAGYTRLDASPALDVATSGGQLFHSAPLFQNDQFVSGSVQLKLPLYAGGQISAGIQAAHAAATAAGADERTTLAQLKLEVAHSYVAVLRARRALAAAQSSATSLAAHARDVQQMYDRELVAKSDLLAARVALANAEQARQRASNAVKLAEAAYNRRLGEPLERTPALDEHLPVDAGLAELEFSALLSRALSSRSELNGQQARADSLRASSRAELGNALPRVGLTGAYTHLDNQFLDRQNISSVGIGFTWSVFDGGQARNRAAALASEGRAAERRLEDLRSVIELQVRQAWLDVQDARARVHSSEAVIAQAQENLRATRELYGAGMGTNTQVLEAVSLQVDAVSNRDNALLDESLSELELARAVGSL